MSDKSDIQFLSGAQPVAEALRYRRRPLYRLHLSRGKGAGDLADLAEKAGVEILDSSSEKVGRLAGTSKHQGVVLECGELPMFDIDEILRFEPPGGRDLLVLLSGVEDPRNLGAVARCCSFFGVRALIIPSKGAAPLSPSASRASAGALESLPVAVVKGIPEVCRSMEEAGYEVVGVEKGGEPISGWFSGDGKTAMLIGSEDRGLPGRFRAACSRIVTIEGQGPTGSLNLSVAAGIAIHHAVSMSGKWKMENEK